VVTTKSVVRLVSEAVRPEESEPGGSDRYTTAVVIDGDGALAVWAENGVTNPEAIPPIESNGGGGGGGTGLTLSLQRIIATNRAASASARNSDLLFIRLISQFAS
jgi:hypothetical protein